MNNKWFGEFRTLKRSSWLSIQYWKWCLLNIWCVFDVLLFPVLFVLFYIIHICRDKWRKKRGNLLQRSANQYRRMALKLRVQHLLIRNNPWNEVKVTFFRLWRSLGKSRKCSPKLHRKFTKPIRSGINSGDIYYVLS